MKGRVKSGKRDRDGQTNGTNRDLPAAGGALRNLQQQNKTSCYYNGQKCHDKSVQKLLYFDLKLERLNNVIYSLLELEPLHIFPWES